MAVNLMGNLEKNDPLFEWNRLNVVNTEQAFASALYQCVSETTSAIDKFSMWLLAGTGASGALLISQIDSILPFLTTAGFKTCLGLLVVSAIFGFASKYKALRCEMQLHMQQRLQCLLDPVFHKHGDNEKTIQEYASQRGVILETEIRFSNVITEFAKPFPWWAKRLISWHVKKNEGDVQASHRMAFKAYMGQIRWAFCQAVSFLSFMAAGIWYASAI